VWTLQGDVVYTLSGHTSFVYSLSVLPNGGIVSGGEDRSVRVWRGA
jgi:phospholipase A-2-activating protein